MMSFRQHLCTNENVRRALPGLVERFVHRAFALRAVTVDASYRTVGKALAQGIFEAFGTFTQRFDRLAALSAARVERPHVTTVMTSQLPASRVYREPRVTPITAGNMPAARTDQCWSKAATVQEDQNLPIGLQVTADGLRQRFADAVDRRRTTCVDETNSRWFCAPRPRR